MWGIQRAKAAVCRHTDSAILVELLANGAMLVKRSSNSLSSATWSQQQGLSIPMSPHSNCAFVKMLLDLISLAGCQG